jgi:hypothetical protein
MTYTRGSRYSFWNSWGWALWRPKHVEFDVAVNKCLHTDASSWSFLLIMKFVFADTVIYNNFNYTINKEKIKCTLVLALRLFRGRTVHRGSRGIALPFLDHGTRRGWRVSVTPQPLFTPGKKAVPIVQEAGWTTGQVWTGVENLAHTGIRSPDRPAPRH